jgi:integrase/recombinase XerC
MLIDPFITYLKIEKHYSAHTLKAYEKDLKQFLSFTGEDHHRSDSDACSGHRPIRQWIVHLMDQGISPRTARRKLSVLSSYYRYLIRNGLAIANPMVKVSLPKWGRPLPVFIPENKLALLLDGVDFGDDYTGVRNRLLIEILYLTGLRRSEVVGLNNSDVDLMNMALKVRGKGGKERFLPFGPSFSTILAEYIKKRESEFGKGTPAGPFFLTSGNKRIYPELVYRVVRKYLKLVAAGGKRSPHILRHSFATHMLNHGADLNAIKELLGHASLNATQVYTHNSFTRLKKVYKQAHPRA